MRKRSEFEHKINARGADSSDFAKYAEFEINVDSLRKRRVQRLRIKSTPYSGQQRIFFLLDRATRRFPGDIALWMQQIEYARRQKAYRKLTQILTRALRLQPTNHELWAYASLLAMEEHGDVTQARGYMQRGLRFCKTSKSLWLEYMRIELVYLAKLMARREILGISDRDNSITTITAAPQLNSKEINEESTAVTLVTQDENHDIQEVGEELRDSSEVGNLTGAIHIAIFDAAMNQFNNDEMLAYDFFNMVWTTGIAKAFLEILMHISNHLEAKRPASWITATCRIKICCAGISTTSSAFPAALRACLDMIQETTGVIRKNPCFIDAIQTWLQDLLGDKDLDPALRQVLRSVDKQLRLPAENSPPREA